MTKIIFQESIPSPTNESHRIYNYGKDGDLEASYIVLQIYDLKDEVIGDARYDMKTQQIVSEEFNGFVITYSVVRYVKQAEHDIYIYSVGERLYQTIDQSTKIIRQNEVIQNVSFCDQNIINAKMKTKLNSDHTMIQIVISF